MEASDDASAFFHSPIPSSSCEEEKESASIGKKRRRSPVSSSSEEDSDPDQDDAGNTKSKKSKRNRRKNIRKIQEGPPKDEKARDAIRQEEERQRRLKDRLAEEKSNTTIGKHEAYQRFWDGCINPTAPPEDRVHVLPEIARILKPHQIEGVKFMWYNVAESLKRAKKEKGLGCILSHVMGLGKTIQAVTLMELFMRYKVGNHCLVIAPVSTTRNWVHELRNKWISKKNEVFVFEMSKGFKTNSDRCAALKRWSNIGGVFILGFEMFRNLVQGGRIRNEELKTKMQSLILKTPSLIVVDEGHKIKNDRSGIGQAIKQVQTMRRIILTGTPLQNNLMEYYCMVDFVRPKYLGTRSEFLNQFVNPIKNGQCIDSSTYDKKLMRKRAFALNDALKGFVHRRDYSDIEKELPPKHDYSIFVRLSPVQKALYKAFLKVRPNSMFKSYHTLSKISTHPDVLYKLANENKGKEEFSNDWWVPILNKFRYMPGCVENSGKFVVCFSLLQQILSRGDKAVVFSQSLVILDLMEMFLSKYFHYKKSEHFFRIDGSIAAENRQSDIDEFNKPANLTKSNVFLVSTRAGALGINLIGGNHVIIMDASWNPANDLQATFRCYRFGQTKAVYIYRLIAADTIEQVIYERQISKRGMALRIVDEHEIEHLWQDNDLFKYEDSDPEEEPDRERGGWRSFAPAARKAEPVNYRSCIVLDGSDDEVREVTEVGPSASALARVKKRKQRKRVTQKLYGESVLIPNDSPLLDIIAKFAEGEQLQMSKEQIARIQAERARQKEESLSIPPPPIPIPPPIYDSKGAPAPPFPSLGLSLSLELQFPHGEVLKTLNQATLDPNIAIRSSHTNGIPVFSGRGMYSPGGGGETGGGFKGAFWTERKAWIKGLHMSKQLLAHQNNNVLTTEEQIQAKDWYKKLKEKKENDAPQHHQTNSNSGRDSLMFSNRLGASGKNHMIEAIKTWGTDKVGAFLDSLRIPQYKTNFKFYQINGEILFHLTKQDLIHLGMTTPKHRSTLLTRLNSLIIQGSDALSRKWRAIGSEDAGDVYFHNKLESGENSTQWEQPQEMEHEFELAGVSQTEVQTRRRRSKSSTQASPAPLMSAQQLRPQGPQVEGGRSKDEPIDLT
ncbi:hypothetical protein AAMO2058_001262300 [Amorphochlora amoebiformis]